MSNWSASGTGHMRIFITLESDNTAPVKNNIIFILQKHIQNTCSKPIQI